MKIISIDVGMKNLAYCLFNFDKNSFTIQQWCVLDLCNDEYKKCQEIQKKNKKICNKNAKYCKNDTYYCKTHASNSNFKIPKEEYKIKKLKKFKFHELLEICKTMCITTEKKIKKTETFNKIIKELSDNYLDFYSSKKTSNYNLIDYGIKLKDKFNEHISHIDIDLVLIENQIGPMALKMKTLQGMIMQHFIETKCYNIKEISASNKLKDFLGNKKTSYNERKKEGVRITREILIKNNLLNDWVETFNKHRKKDDLADSFLQGLWYINHFLKKDVKM